MKRALANLQAAGAIRREERVAAGRVGGAVWVIGSLSVIALALVVPGSDRGSLIAIGAGGCLWGVLTGLLVRPEGRADWMIHLSAVLGLAAIAAATALTGGGRSPAWACLFYVVVYAAYFLKPPMAAAYFIACVAVECVVVLTAAHTDQAESTARLVVSAPAFVVLGSAIVAGRRFMYELRRRAERIAAEHGAMRRVATAVVSGEPAESFYQLVAREAGQLLDASGAGVLRLSAGREATILGSWARQPDREYDVGEHFPLTPGSEVATALAAGEPVELTPRRDSALRRLGYGSSIVAPIRVGRRTWGFLAVVAGEGETLTPEHTERLNEFAELIATSVSNIEDRAALAAQAATDALTGIGNHRTFHQRLNADLARARRYGSPVSVALIDVDHFKQVNDTGGHEAGDERLRHVAGCLQAAARAEDTLARVGGDEFAWILPETSGHEALAAVERARRAISADVAPDGVPPITISAGVCDSGWATEPSALVRLADRALYVSKEQGRDQVHLYEPSTDELSTMVRPP